MFRGALLAFVFALAGCDYLSEFERELSGAEAKAWQLCAAKFNGKVYSPPPYGEQTDDYILFSWNIDDAESEGGPLYCRTNGDGTKLISFEMSKSASK